MKFLPTTVTQTEKLRRLARVLRRRDGMPLATALDTVAREHGYVHWKHVTECVSRTGASHRRPGSADSPTASRYEVSLIARWADRQAGGQGTEIARVALSQPWWEFLSLEQRRRVASIKSFRIDGQDRSRLVSTHDFSSHASAHFNATKAARLLAFIDALRVLPATWREVTDSLGWDTTGTRFPALDHELAWHDPATGAHFLTNEPYADKLATKRETQASWLVERGLLAMNMPGGSFHNPPGTVLQIIVRADQPAALRSLQERLAGLDKALAAVG